MTKTTMCIDCGVTIIGENWRCRWCHERFWGVARLSDPLGPRRRERALASKLPRPSWWRRLIAWIFLAGCVQEPGGIERTCATTDVCDGDVVVTAWTVCAYDGDTSSWSESWRAECRARDRSCLHYQCDVTCEPTELDATECYALPNAQIPSR